MTTESKQDNGGADTGAAQEAVAQEPKYITVQEMQQMMDRQANLLRQQVMAQVSGLASKIDTGLNAVRRDTKSWAEQQVGDLRSELGRQAWLTSLDEDQRKMAEPLLKEIDRARQGHSEAPTSAERQAPGAENAQLDEQAAAQAWEQVYGIVEAMGLQRDTPGIDYAALTDSALDDTARRVRFLGSLRQALVKTPAPSAPAKTTTAGTVNPPVEPVPRGTAGYRNTDQVMDAYLAGQISIEQAKQHFAAHGQQFPGG